MQKSSQKKMKLRAVKILHQLPGLRVSLEPLALTISLRQQENEQMSLFFYIIVLYSECRQKRQGKNLNNTI